MTVTDNFGATHTNKTTVTISDATPPSPKIVAHTSVTIGESVQFNSDNSTIGDAEITTYEWDFGDLSTSTEPNPMHTFTTEGTYTVTLKLTDKRGKTASTTVDVIASIKAAKPETKSNSSSGSLAWLSLFLLSVGGLNRRIKNK